MYCRYMNAFFTLLLKKKIKNAFILMVYLIKVGLNMNLTLNEMDKVTQILKDNSEYFK